jgi:putative FmdB family regulatory protein
MPLFEYACEGCAYKFDRLVLSANSEVKCPICQGPVKKLYSSFAVGHSQTSGFNSAAPFEPKICKNC